MVSSGVGRTHEVATNDFLSLTSNDIASEKSSEASEVSASGNPVMAIRAVIVDDEPLARKRIHDLLREDPEVEIIGECGTGSAAMELLEREKPNLLFLDVQMPEIDGFELLEAAEGSVPAVIFVTAYDKYALRAFDAQAVDYLLKPFNESRFQQALQRAKEKICKATGGQMNAELLSLLKDVQTGRKPAERLVIKSGGRVLFLKATEIDYVEAAGNYLNLYVGKETHLIRETMQSLEARLDPDRFLRIHRSTIVNLERIKELQPWFGGEYVVILRDGRKLTLSRTYRARVQQLLEA
jgi:two-component system, LytTR family, response regulator